MPDNIRVTIQRQDSPQSQPYNETFEVPHKPQMNVISLLQDIAASPVTTEGRETTPVVWDCNCLEEVCGACSMVINGRARQACTALIDNLLKEHPTIDLKPMSKFPVIRDLFVDRKRMFNALKKVKAWIPVDTYGYIGEGPITSPETHDVRYPLSQCMTCGCCLEVCPQVNENSDFIGPQAIGQAMLFNTHPTGAMTANERLDALMEKGGVADCGNAQNCVKACPKGVPLTWAIGKAGRDTTALTFRRWFMKK
ncbi:MAG: succinate dehydrogenase iron-sulfur subunit [Phycisphaerales bacterium]|nr:succinate dehydrogenase iron-sulfur subunit [Phycisphaerales bacterium]